MSNIHDSDSVCVHVCVCVCVQSLAHGVNVQKPFPLMHDLCVQSVFGSVGAVSSSVMQKEKGE